MTVAEITETEAPPDTEPLPPAACAACGILLDADGTPDVSRLAESVKSAEWTRALIAEHDQAQAAVTRWRREAEAARRIEDTDTLVAVSRRLAVAEDSVKDTKAAIAGRPGVPPEHGTCPDCETPYRNGLVDAPALERTVRERDRLVVQARALEHEFRGAEYAVAVKQQGLAEAKAAGDKRSTAEYEEALEVALAYQGGVTEALQAARAELAALNPKPATRKARRR